MCLNSTNFYYSFTDKIDKCGSYDNDTMLSSVVKEKQNKTKPGLISGSEEEKCNYARSGNRDALKPDYNTWTSIPANYDIAMYKSIISSTS